MHISKFIHNCVRRVRLTIKLEHCSFPHSYTRWKIEKLSLCFIQFNLKSMHLTMCVRAFMRASNARIAIKCNSSVNANTRVVFEVNNVYAMCISNLNTIAGTFCASPTTCGYVFVAHLSPVPHQKSIRNYFLKAMRIYSHQLLSLYFHCELCWCIIINKCACLINVRTSCPVSEYCYAKEEEEEKPLTIRMN